MNVSLSDAARSVWGKTDRTGASSVGWLPLWRHLADTTSVAGRLWDEWVSPAVADCINASLPDGNGRALLTWLAGVHDIGKATPAFACQAEHLVDRMRDCGLDYPHETIKAHRRLAPHATAGQVIVAEWLTGDHGWSDAHGVAVVIGGHHGMPPTETDIQAVNLHPSLLGDDKWICVQRELLAWMTDRTNAGNHLAAWREISLSQPAQSVLTGLVIMADWIASNEEFFPYTLNPRETERIDSAWNALDLPAPWKAVELSSTVDTLFAARFQLPPGATPRPVQHMAVQAARVMPVPGMMIVEAAMGEGKTEAALAAVEILAQRCGASGCLIALPTRATSDAMFGRVLSWLRHLPNANDERGDHDIMLAHGKAAFNTDFDALKWKSLPAGIGVDDGGSAVGVHQWLAGRKRSMLSNFVIGTIDQLLFAALRSRHLVLRHLGLAGKVVVIDEAHAYDVYMNSFLGRTLEWLGAYGVPVVVLSATLPAERRAGLMRDYDNGRLGPLPKPTWRDRGSPAVDHYSNLRNDLRYPLITTSTPQRGGTSAVSAESGRGTAVRLQRLDDDLEQLADLLRAQLGTKGCALIVRNTVARVQQTADGLRHMLGPEFPVSVAHSRFMAPDRAAKDTWLRSTFGPPGTGSRPERHIVVASQVAEQSLDIDFDLLVTDLAPVDLVLQRIGRLHRHSRPDRPAHLAEASCYVTGANWTVEPPKAVAGSCRVYQESTLLRAAAALDPYLSTGTPLRLPADIAQLIQSAYSDRRIGPHSWQIAMADAAHRAAEERAEKERKAEGFLLGSVAGPGSTLIGWLSGGVGNTDERTAQGHVRDDDSESLEVLLLVRTADGLVTPPWIGLGGELVPTEAAPERGLARRIARCSLPLPRMMTAPDVIDATIAELERRNSFEAWTQNHWLAGELILEIDGDGRARLDGFNLHYDVHEGLRVSKLDGRANPA